MPLVVPQQPETFPGYRRHRQQLLQQHRELGGIMDRKLCGIDSGIPPSCDAAAAADAVVELGGIPGLLAAALTVLTSF